ncbi:vWA domain-containing protein [Bacillus dakarensis]|uniref:vWA domain-containing protein n=1 Tax=Robertmurraya dakarensis TaxID=1926278 RepID=UPI000980DCBD|nr:VWA domain-containing protein [Bacillus dakarensis]
MSRMIYLMLLSFVLILSGCSEKQEANEPAPEKAAENKEVQKVEETEEKQSESGNEEVGFSFEELKSLKIPDSIEDFQDVKPGLLTKDLSYESETALWAKLDGLEGIKEETKNAMEKVLEETKDPDTLFKAFIYLLGNNAYEETVGRLAAMKPNFDEPLLPEPEELAASAENSEDRAPEKAILLLDASSSMLLSVDGQQKMEVAKNAVRSFAKTIGETSDVSLYVYGHAGTQEDKDKALSCSKIDEVYPLQPYQEESFFKAVQNVEAKGWTPLAEAIKTAREASASYDGDITLYIVSDGAETCDGDPVEEAKLFAADNEQRKVNIIGFNVDAKAENQLKEVALAGNGEYIPAHHPDDLKESIKHTWVPSTIDIMSKQWSSPKNTFPVMFQKLDIDKLSQTIGHAVNQENTRFRHTIQLLKKEGLITTEQETALNERVEAYKGKLTSLKDELAAKKKQEIDDEVERIDQKIQDWTERMEKIREENGK